MAAWTSRLADLATFPGDYVEFADVLARTRPLTGHTRQSTSAITRAALRRTARSGDGWMPVFPAGEPPRQGLDALAVELSTAGRDPASVAVMPMYLLDGPGASDQRAAAARHWGEFAEFGLAWSS